LDFWEAEIEEYESDTDSGMTRYSSDYIKKLKKFKASVNEILITYGKDYPVQYNLEGDGFETRFVVAPRIEEDDL
jgi:hypothetical protein